MNVPRSAKRTSIQRYFTVLDLEDEGDFIGCPFSEPLPFTPAFVTYVIGDDLLVPTSPAPKRKAPPDIALAGEDDGPGRANWQRQLAIPEDKTFWRMKKPASGGLLY
jgi:hypothetical protein